MIPVITDILLHATDHQDNEKAAAFSPDLLTIPFIVFRAK
jgi:hypothetical protein